MRNKIYPVLLVIFTMLLTSVASSQAITSQKTYTACVTKKSGAIKIVKANKKCTKKQNKISWNNGTESLDSIYLSPQDFYPISGEEATFETPNLGGWNHPAWALPGTDDANPGVITTVPKPANWENVDQIQITFYWAASASDGNVYLDLCVGELLVGDQIETCGYGDGVYFDVPETNK
ncbi:MAG: hypothetical protein NT032_00970, partial [Actinobacteria bacterium]|nr:hypothetical protein [Actinomycetota bacterium]